MSGKGIRALRMVESEPAEPVVEPETPAEDLQQSESEPPTVEQLQEANKALQVQIQALGVQFSDPSNMLRNIAVDVLIGLLIENGVIDREQFVLRQETAINGMLERTLEQVKVDVLARQREALRQQADLEVVKGPGLLGPRGQRLHG